MIHTRITEALPEAEVGVPAVDGLNRAEEGLGSPVDGIERRKEDSIHRQVPYSQIEWKIDSSGIEVVGAV